VDVLRRFNPDNAWVESTKQLYRKGGIGDVVVKKKLVLFQDIIEILHGTVFRVLV
jgi:hypothetical protein